MRKHLLASAALLIAAVAFTAPASADVDVVNTVTFDKQVTVTETLFIEKTVTISVTGEFLGSSAAESVTVMNQANDGNTFTYVSGELGNRLIADYFAVMSGSVNDNIGITQFNQDVGSMNNQANSVSAAVSFQAFFAESAIEVEQYTTNNFADVDGTATFVLGFPPERFNRFANMTDSVNGNLGVTQVNQSAGVMNNQANAVDLGVGSETAVALSEASLGQTNTNNQTFDVATVRGDLIQNSVNNNHGITSVNQSAGNFNNQGTVISISGSAHF